MVCVRASVCVRPCRASVTFFVDATPLKLLNRFCWNFVQLFATICRWSYYTAILIRQILRELWDFMDLELFSTFCNFVDATPLKLLNRFCWNFVQLFATICRWSYYTAILIRQILRELWDFMDLELFSTFCNFVDATPLKLLNRFCWNFVQLFATICRWSYYTAILIRQILRELLDFMDLELFSTFCNFVDATPLKLLNRFCWNFVQLFATICRWSYYTAILIRQILRELWDFMDLELFSTFCNLNIHATAGDTWLRVAILPV